MASDSYRWNTLNSQWGRWHLTEDLNFGDEKVGLSEVNLPGGYEPGPKSESWTWLWSNRAELERGEAGRTPCQRPLLLPALLRAFGAGLLISSHSLLLTAYIVTKPSHPSY